MVFLQQMRFAAKAQPFDPCQPCVQGIEALENPVKSVRVEKVARAASEQQTAATGGRLRRAGTGDFHSNAASCSC